MRCSCCKLLLSRYQRMWMLCSKTSSLPRHQPDVSSTSSSSESQNPSWNIPNLLKKLRLFTHIMHTSLYLTLAHYNLPFHHRTSQNDPTSIVSLADRPPQYHAATWNAAERSFTKRWRKEGGCAGEENFLGGGGWKWAEFGCCEEILGHAEVTVSFSELQCLTVYL